MGNVFNFYDDAKIVKRPLQTRSSLNRLRRQSRQNSPQLSSVTNPGSVPSDKLTTVYKVPGSKFKTEKDVLNHYNYELGEVLGKGGFATVYKAYNSKYKVSVACKIMDFKSDSKGTQDDMKNELFTMIRVNHPFIMYMFHNFIVNQSIFIFMQLANGGSFSNFLSRYGPLDEYESKAPFCQILSGVCHMHKQNIAHKDLKLANLLLMMNDNDEYNILIADFGLSRVAYSEDKGVLFRKTYCGTQGYMAPEICGKQRYNPFLVDVWAIGVILYQMLFSEYPYDFERGDRRIDPDSNYWYNLDSVSSDCSDLMSKIFVVNPRKRISLKKLTRQRWISEEFKYVDKLARQAIQKTSTSSRSRNSNRSKRSTKSKKSTGTKKKSGKSR